MAHYLSTGKKKTGEKSRYAINMSDLGAFKLINGLGQRYFDVLSQNLDDIHQLDTTSGEMESNGTVLNRSIQLAESLTKRGVKEGDIVVISSRSHSDETIVILACLFIGAILAPIDMDAVYNDWIALIGKLRPKIGFCDLRAVSQLDRSLILFGLSGEIVVFGDLNIGNKTLFSTMFLDPPNQQFTPVDIADPSNQIAFILPTQGTAGPMKLVCLSHLNVLVRTMLLIEVMGRPQRLLSYYTLPYGMQCMVICASFESNITRFMPGAFNERNCCKIIHDLHIDLMILNTQYCRLLCRNVAIKDFDLSSLKKVIIGGTYTGKEDLVHFNGTLPTVQFIQVYNLQETGIIAATPIREYQDSMKKLMSCGKILPFSKVKIVDINTGEELGPRHMGHIYFSGESLMLGYLTKRTSINFMKQDYFMTEDVGKFDEQGWLYQEGRLEDVVTGLDNSGYRFTVREVEGIIKGYAIVLDAVVIGNETDIVCCVVKRPDSNLQIDKLKTFVDARLPPYKRPSKYLIYDSFPMTSLGKIKRYILREEVFHTKLCVVDSLAEIYIPM